MRLTDKKAIVTSLGLNENDAAEWYQKYYSHFHGSIQRGLDSELSFSQYLQKAVAAGISDPSKIGRENNQHQLGRVGDIGNYTEANCRFISVEQNRHECFENGRTLEGNERRAEQMRGQTKETSERVRRMAETVSGRTKENHPGVAASAEKRSREFILIDPNGVEHRGKNLSEFCDNHGLRKFNVYNVFAGRQSNHKGWTGRYVEDE